MNNILSVTSTLDACVTETTRVCASSTKYSLEATIRYDVEVRRARDTLLGLRTIARAEEESRSIFLPPDDVVPPSSSLPLVTPQVGAAARGGGAMMTPMPPAPGASPSLRRALHRLLRDFLSSRKRTLEAKLNATARGWWTWTCDKVGGVVRAARALVRLLRASAPALVFVGVVLSVAVLKGASPLGA